MDRKHDIELIEKELRNPGLQDFQRALLKQQLRRIQNETPKIKSMRAALIKAHQEGNTEEVNDIRNFVNGRSDYQS
jgi:hypothetical protein